jgi:16S rRNA G1207 methylase RsmC
MPNSDTQRYFLPLLDRHVRLHPTARVLEMGYYDPDAALWAAGRAAHVVALRPTVDLTSEVETLARSQQIPNIEVRLDTQIQPDERATFDTAILLAPFFLGNAPVHQAIDTAAAALKSDGSLYVQVHRRAGGESYVRYAAGRFEDTEFLGMGGGQRRLYAARRPRPELVSAQTEGAAEQPSIEFSARGVSVQLRLAAGVFAARAIDPGSQLLLHTLDVRMGSEILDLGCGGGVIGLTLAAADPEASVVLVDSSKAAVDLTRENATRNGLHNVDIRAGDGFAPVTGHRFDAIVSNLPAHRGHKQDLSIAERFIAEAPRHLKDDGAAWFVANRALPYELPASRAFRQVRIAADDGRYKVLHCVLPQRSNR